MLSLTVRLEKGGDMSVHLLVEIARIMIYGAFLLESKTRIIGWHGLALHSGCFIVRSPYMYK
jgi:hypothetical protein